MKRYCFRFQRRIRCITQACSVFTKCRVCRTSLIIETPEGPLPDSQGESVKKLHHPSQTPFVLRWFFAPFRSARSIRGENFRSNKIKTHPAASHRCDGVRMAPRRNPHCCSFKARTPPWRIYRFIRLMLSMLLTSSRKSPSCSLRRMDSTAWRADTTLSSQMRAAMESLK